VVGITGRPQQRAPSCRGVLNTFKLYAHTIPDKCAREPDIPHTFAI